MALDRRDFVRLGALGTAGITASSCGLFDTLKTTPLGIVIRGLCFVERHGTSADVHLIDSTKVGMPVHEPVLSVNAADLQSHTGPSAPDDWMPGRIVFRLANTVRLDAGINRAPDLTEEDAPIGENLPVDDNDHWKSVRYAVRLKDICKLSNVTVDKTKVAADLTLEHGDLRALRPVEMNGGESLGTHVIWTFTDSSGANVVTQALTNALLCTVTAGGSTATFTIGSHSVVVKLPAEVWVRNLPPPGARGTCAGSARACISHMAAYYSLIGVTNGPTVTATIPSGARPVPDGIEPDYCPPGI